MRAAVRAVTLSEPTLLGLTAIARRKPVEALTDREFEVLTYLPTRLSNHEIGLRLYVSVNTVKSHLKSIYRKLGVRDRDEAVARALEVGMLSAVPTCTCGAVAMAGAAEPHGF